MSRFYETSCLDHLIEKPVLYCISNEVKNDYEIYSKYLSIGATDITDIKIPEEDIKLYEEYANSCYHKTHTFFFVDEDKEKMEYYEKFVKSCYF